MGWSGGKEVFDRIVGVVQEYVEPVMQTEGFEDEMVEVYKEIIDTLRDADWDTLCASEYYDHPLIGPLLKIDEEDEEY